MNKQRTSRIFSFRNAFAGIWHNLRHGTNFQIQSVIALLVIIAGIFFDVSFGKWAVIILSIGTVLSLEAMNTAIEKICDRFMADDDPAVKTIKDSAAAAVLVMSVAAAIVGMVIFVPYLLDILNISV